jgi:hypothetical protein
MTDVSQGPGWWMASDHKWYPPELHPAVRAAAVTQAASALVADADASLASTGLAVASPGAAPGAMAGYGGPGTYAPYGSTAVAGGVPVATLAAGTDVAVGKRTGRGRARRARAKTPVGMVAGAVPAAGFDANPYALSHRGPVGPTPSKKKGHLAGPLVAVIVVALVAVVGAVGYVLTHPSPHRSPDAVALDFYQKLGASPPDYAGALADIAPDQQAQAGSLGSLHEVQAVMQELQTENLSVLNPSNPTSTSKAVVIQGCNATLSCGPEEPAVAAVEIGGKWYVDFTSWDATAVREFPPSP